MTPKPDKEIEALALELADLARHAPGKLGQRVEALSIREQAELALRLPAKERLELLMHAPRPMRLVRSLPDSEFYLTVREIGPSDALALVSLGSASQLHHLLDLEAWDSERFDANRAGAWVALVLEAGEPALRRFIRSSDDELLALLFQQWIRVTAIEPEDGHQVGGEGQTEAGDERGLISPDGYYRFSPSIREHAAAVNRITAVFFTFDAERYASIIWMALYELPSQLEEEALRWRQSRLEEHGFPPWEEALSIYAPPEGVMVHPEPPEPTDPDGLAAPRSVLRLPSVGDRMGQALEGLPDEIRERVFHEMVSLANHLMVADRLETREPAAHGSALEKGVGYVNIALEVRRADDPAELREILTEIPLIELFREGHALAVELRERGRALIREGWGRAHPRAIEMLDSPLRDRIAAISESRPLYFELLDDGKEQKVRTRPFRSLSELDETRASVEIAEIVGRVLVLDLNVDLEALVRRLGHPEADPPRLSTLLLTLLARHAAHGELGCDPLPAAMVADFLRDVASRRTAAPDAPTRALDALCVALGETFDLTAQQLGLFGGFGRACLEQLFAECGSLYADAPLDPARVRCLLLE